MMLATFFYYLKINHKHMIIFDDDKKKMENLTRILMLRLKPQIKKISKKIYLF